MNCRKTRGNSFTFQCGILALTLMKALSSCLILVLLVHLQCAGSCLAESSAPKTAPACPQHAKTPSNGHQPNESNGPCTQGPQLESKLSTGKVVFDLDALFPASPVIAQATDATVRYTFLDHPLVVLSLPVPISILRI